MSTYKGINGTSVVNYAGDLPNAIDGQVWYDSTAAAFKYQYPNVTSAGAWSTGGALNTGRYYGGGAGSQTTAIFYGGEATPGVVGNTESYNGSAWTEVADLNTARVNLGGAGASNTSALAIGGDPARTITESWNGSSWTEVNDLNTGRGRTSGLGIQTAALFTGGTPPNDGTAINESWNGTSWTEVGDLNTARTYVAVSGTYTSAITGGGASPPGTNLTITESWNGSAWTEVADLNTANGGRISFGQDNSNAISATGGNTELWNGSSWTETTDMSVPRFNAGAGETPSTAGIIFGGSSPAPYSTATELFTGAGAGQTRTFTDS